MKKLNKVASLFATAALATSMSGAMAQSVDNWVSGTGLPWKNGTNELCWRDGNWTPATAHPDCDGALKKVAAPAPAPAPPPPAARAGPGTRARPGAGRRRARRARRSRSPPTRSSTSTSRC